MSTERFGSEGPLKQLSPSLQKLMEFERFHLHRLDLFQVSARDPTFDSRYFPQNCGAFTLPCYWIPRRKLYVYGQQQSADNEAVLFEGDGASERVLFPIHPSALEEHRSCLTKTGAQDASHGGSHLWAVPTASTRTLLVWPDQRPEKAFFFKTTLHSRIFGDKRISRHKVARGVGFSRLVEGSKASLPKALEYLFEPVGYVPRAMQDSGVLVRLLPQDVKDGRVLIAPLFSLVGGSRGYTPLYIAILERVGGEPRELVESLFCAGFSRLWLEMVFRFGLIFESHGQDLMLVLSPELQPLDRFVYRDFEGLTADWVLRRRLGLSTENLPHDWSWYETYETWGGRYFQLVWHKLRISLYLYLHFVLHELEAVLCDWQKRRLIGGTPIREGEVTMMFSRHMMKGLHDMFGMSEAAQYDIYSNLNRFVLLLMKVRQGLIRA